MISFRNIILVLVTFAISCSQNEVKFKTAESGLQYAIVEHRDTAQQPHINDAVAVDMQFYWNDSLMFDTKDVSLNYRIKIEDPKQKGKLNEGLLMLHKGDSAIFRVDAFDFYQYTAGIQMPDCIKKGDKLTFYVRLIDILTPEQIAKERERLKKMKLQNEKILLSDYLRSNNYNVEPEPSGFYYIELKKGTGLKPKNGDSVVVHYEGRFINNQPFESTLAINRPYTFLMGDTLLLESWTKGISKMREGGVALIIIPSSLAYGEIGVKDLIPPYSTLVYEVHLLEVKRK